MRKRAHCSIVAIVGGFFPRFFQVGFELFNSLVESGIIAETLRLENTLSRTWCKYKGTLRENMTRTCHSRLVSSARRSFKFVKYCRSLSFWTSYS